MRLRLYSNIKIIWANKTLTILNRYSFDYIKARLVRFYFNNPEKNELAYTSSSLFGFTVIHKLISFLELIYKEYLTIRTDCIYYHSYLSHMGYKQHHSHHKLPTRNLMLFERQNISWRPHRLCFQNRNGGDCVVIKPFSLVPM
jgi:hypothetical protein